MLITPTFRYLAALCTVCVLLGHWIPNQANFQLIWRLGFGRMSPLTTLTSPNPKGGMHTVDILPNVLRANVAQPILSTIYFSYNGMFTAMSAAMEWESYARHRKGLRVSDVPEGNQRTTYFLQLPYRMAIPLMITSGLLHWLVSQSLFFVAIDFREYDAKEGLWLSSTSGFGCGFSILAIICTVMVGAVMLLALIITASLKFKTNIPVVASCSAAITAACHVPAEESGRETSTSKIRWGVTGYNNIMIGHCSFSKFRVSAPRHGRGYE